jgi:hypothetical protein
MENSNSGQIVPPSFRWGNWLSPPDPSGKAMEFLVPAFFLVALVALAVVLHDFIFVSIPPSRPGAENGSRIWFLWLIVFFIVALTLLHSAISDHVRLDRAEFSLTGLVLTYSHIPTMLGPYEITTVRFGWDEVGRIVEDHIDDGEGGHSYSIKVKLTEPLKTGDTELELSMLDEKEMYQALRKIRVLQG